MSQVFLNNIKPGALRNWSQHDILPSIVAAQAALESGWGTSKLARAPYNNLFGIKASADWSGRTINMLTTEYRNGVRVQEYADFRAYDTQADSIADHGAFFTNTPWREQNYAAVVGETDYIKAAWALQNAPAAYATDPGYANKLINLIEQYGLSQWDREALSGIGQNDDDVPYHTSAGSQSSGVNAVSNVDKTVGDELSDMARRSTTGVKGILVGDTVIDDVSRGYLQTLMPSLRQTFVPDNNLQKVIGRLTTDIRSDDQIIIIVLNSETEANTLALASSIMRVFGEGRKVVFMHYRFHVWTDNTLTQVSKGYPNAFKSNFFSFARTKPDYLEGATFNDGLTEDGHKGFAEFVTMAAYEALTGDFSTRTAQTEVMQYHDIKDYELTEDGIIRYEMFSSATGEKVMVERQTDIKGLHSPMGDDAIYNPAANVIWGPKEEGNRSLWLTDKFNADLKGVELVMAGMAELISRAEPAQQYTISLLDVPESLSIGDTGIFIDHEHNPPLYIQARVLKLTTSKTNPSLNKAVIGNVVQLFAQDKTFLNQTRQEVATARNQLLEEYRSGAPKRVEITSTNGVILKRADGEEAQTDLIARVYQGDYEVTDRYLDWVWERTSTDAQSDAAYNDMMEQAHSSNVLTVYESELIGESTFTVKVYDERGLVTSANVVLRMTADGKDGKTAYQQAVEHGFVGTESEWLESLKGEDGKGIPGEPGEDGLTPYFHTAWADDNQGTGFTTTHVEGKAWLGYVTTYEPDDPEDWTVYDWQLVKGEPGDDGQTTYFHRAWTDDLNGGGFTTSESLNKKYMGTYSSFDPEPSQNYQDYQWQRMAQDYADEFQDELNQKAPQGSITEIVNEISSLRALANSKVDSVVFNQQNAAYQEFITLLDTAVKNAQDLAQRVDNANIDILNDLQGQAERWVTQEGYIQIDGDTNTFTITNTASTSQIIVDDEGIKFMDGGVMVGIITGQYLQIMRGIFAQSVQIDQFKFEPFAGDKRRLFLSYLRGGN